MTMPDALVTIAVIAAIVYVVMHSNLIGEPVRPPPPDPEWKHKTKTTTTTVEEPTDET